MKRWPSIVGSLLLVATSSCRERISQAHDRSHASASASASASSRSARPVPPTLPESSIWHSRRSCERLLGQGQRLPRRAGVARIGTWNVRWFPDGRPGKRASESGTDLAWLACAIAWLDLQALAVQEFKAHPRARQRADELVHSLDRHTGGRWKLVLDDCRGGDASQHVGILYDSRRVKASEPVVLAALNPHGSACKDQLRPGLALRLAFEGGLDLWLVSVHQKSGSERRSLELRKRALEAIPQALSELSPLGREADVVLAGDFNTMGCRKCSPPVSARSELEATDRLLSGMPTPLVRVPADASCSQHSGHGPSLLDHLVLTRATRELPEGSRARVSGYCRDAACQLRQAERDLPPLRALSDHCPVVLDLTDRDLD